MYKYFPLVVAAVLFSLLFPMPVSASQVEWQITWHDDNTLSEAIIIDEASNLTNPVSWQTSRVDGKTVMNRKISDWEAYNRLEDKLPIIVESKDFLVFSLTLMNIDEDYSSQKQGTFYQLTGFNEGTITIKCPSFIIKSSANSVDNLTATWNLKQFEHSTNLLQVLVFNGLWLGISLFVLGFLAVFWMYYRNLKKSTPDN